jgi:hypothetical protein
MIAHFPAGCLLRARRFRVAVNFNGLRKALSNSLAFRSLPAVVRCPRHPIEIGFVMAPRPSLSGFMVPAAPCTPIRQTPVQERPWLALATIYPEIEINRPAS